MLPFLSLIAPVSGIIKEIAASRRAEAEAETHEAKIEAEERTEALKARRDVLVAESSTPLNAAIRGLFAVPVALYFAKLYLLDKVLGLGTTDPLSPILQEVAMIVIGFYFVSETAVRVAGVMRRR